MATGAEPRQHRRRERRPSRHTFARPPPPPPPGPKIFYVLCVRIFVHGPSLISSFQGLLMLQAETKIHIIIRIANLKKDFLVITLD